MLTLHLPAAYTHRYRPSIVQCSPCTYQLPTLTVTDHPSFNAHPAPTSCLHSPLPTIRRSMLTLHLPAAYTHRYRPSVVQCSPCTYQLPTLTVTDHPSFNAHPAPTSCLHSPLPTIHRSMLTLHLPAAYTHRYRPSVVQCSPCTYQLPTLTVTDHPSFNAHSITRGICISLRSEL